MNGLYFLLGGIVLIIAFFKRELLVNKKSFTVILALSVALFLVGFLLHIKGEGRGSASGALLFPLLSLGLYRLCRRAFIWRFKREPRDTAFDWSEGMGPDRIFNILFFVLSAWLMVLIAYFMTELSKFR